MSDDSLTTLPPHGASAEEMLRTVLPMVARSSAESAKAATLAATAINSNDGALGELRDAIMKNTAALERFEIPLKALAQEKVENGKWMRTLLSPQLFAQVVLNVLLIVGTLFGVQRMMGPMDTFQVEIPEEKQHEQR